MRTTHTCKHGHVGFCTQCYGEVLARGPETPAPEAMAYLQACSELVERMARDAAGTVAGDDALSLMEKHGRKP